WSSAVCSPDLRYEIRLKGHLGSRWAARFDGMTLTTRADGTTLIEGPVVDHAALHGLLRPRPPPQRRPPRRPGGPARAAPDPARPGPAAALGHRHRPQQGKESTWTPIG